MASEAPEKVVFEQSFEGLFKRALEGKLTPRCHERLKEAGLDLSKKLLPAYPFQVWIRSLEITAEELFPEDPTPVAMRRLGEQFVDGFRETFLGKAVVGLLKVIGPRQGLARASRSFRSGNSYTESRLVEVGPTTYDLWLSEVGPHPGFTQGILTGGLRATGAQTPTVEVVSHDGHACTYRVSWS